MSAIIHAGNAETDWAAIAKDAGATSFYRKAAKLYCEGCTQEELDAAFAAYDHQVTLVKREAADIREHKIDALLDRQDKILDLLEGKEVFTQADVGAVNAIGA